MSRRQETRAEAHAAIREGVRSLGSRSVAAQDAFVDHVMTRARLSRGQAEKVLSVFRKERIIKIDAVNGTWTVKHGAFLDVDVLRRAAGVGR